MLAAFLADDTALLLAITASTVGRCRRPGTAASETVRAPGRNNCHEMTSRRSGYP